jgi:hypothetical protein
MLPIDQREKFSKAPVRVPAMTPDILPKAADPKHLTDALCRSGALADARICDVGVLSSRATVLSPIVRLQSTYDGDPAPSDREKQASGKRQDRSRAQLKELIDELRYFHSPRSSSS